jgi:N-acyl-phosphatidylethanolamine-hydrolysing phospholipase D
MTVFHARFRNSSPHTPHNLLGVLRWKLGITRDDAPSFQLRDTAPAEPEFQAAGAELSAVPARERIRATWIGHSTFLLQHQGRNILTDPIFGNCAPFPIGGLRRAAPPGMSLDSLPPIHDVLISHSHYDHLDASTVRALGREVCYWVPEGLSAWFRKRGFNSCRELGWWQSAALSDRITIHSVPAQHASGRSLFDRDMTHWCGWALKSSDRSIYFVGDSGYSAPLFQEIGQRLGGFDLALIPIGAYRPRWLMQPMHLDPAEAVQVHLDVASHLSVACHWGTFRLTDEPLSEPPILLRQELAARQIDPNKFRVLRPGESVEW